MRTCSSSRSPSVTAEITPFQNAGFMKDRKVWTRAVRASYHGDRATLGGILEPEGEVPEEFFIPADRVEDWRYLKGAKAEPRVHKASGLEYFYQEGAIPFPIGSTSHRGRS